MKNQNERVGKVKNRALAQRWLLTDSNNSVHLSHDRQRAHCAANLLPALGGQGRRRRRLRNRRGVASPREEEDGAGDDWPGRRSAVYCAGALPGTYVGTVLVSWTQARRRASRILALAQSIRRLLNYWWGKRPVRNPWPGVGDPTSARGNMSQRLIKWVNSLSSLFAGHKFAATVLYTTGSGCM